MGRAPAQGQLTADLRATAPFGGGTRPAVRTPNVGTQHLPRPRVLVDSAIVQGLNEGRGDVDTPVTWETPQPSPVPAEIQRSPRHRANNSKEV